MELLDENGKTIEGSRRVDRIQRRLEYDNGWVERSDTRIPPGKTRVFDYNAPTPEGRSASTSSWRSIPTITTARRSSLRFSRAE